MSTSVKEAPHTATMRKQYEEKLVQIKQRQEKELQERIEKNMKYSEEMVQKLITKHLANEAELQKKKDAVNNGFYMEKEPEFFVAIRFRSMISCPPKVKKILTLFRLHKSTNNCAIIKNDKSMKKKLQLCKDYIAYGTISMELLRKLIYKRATATVNAKRINLTNEIVEEYTEGKYKSIEELIHVIYYGGEDFKMVNKLIRTIHLRSPRGGFGGRKKRAFNQGGVAGNHYELLGKLLERMI